MAPSVPGGESYPEATAPSDVVAAFEPRRLYFAPGPSSAPSRHDNPFATCWTRPGALAFRFPEGLSAERLVARLAAQDWHGAIVGPHGSGKSTLLTALQPALCAAGCDVEAFRVRNGRATACAAPSDMDVGRRRIVIVDGFERLAWLNRARLGRRCRRNDLGLLVTAHHSTRIPTLIRLQPNLPLVELLVADLTAKVSTHVTNLDIAASRHRHRDNVREIFFDLYDRHECFRRAERIDERR